MDKNLLLIILGCLVSGLWFMYQDHRAKKNREARLQSEIIRPKPQLKLIKK